MNLTTITVFWLDAAQDSFDSQHTLGETFSPLAAVSSGILLEENEECIVLCRDLFPEDATRVSSMRARICIPRGMIKKFIKFKISG